MKIKELRGEMFKRLNGARAIMIKKGDSRFLTGVTVVGDKIAINVVLDAFMKEKKKRWNDDISPEEFPHLLEIAMRKKIKPASSLKIKLILELIEA